jgi:AcrR family transcriptional regulator
MAALACERGYASVSVALVCKRASVSRTSFYEMFDGREACLLAVLDDGYRHVSALVSEAFEQTDDWLQGGRTALAELLLFLDAEPQLARVCLVESLGAGAWALERRERHVVELTRLIVGYLGMQASREPYPLANAGVMASLVAVLQNHLLAGRREPLVALLGPLVGLATSPYLDAQAVAVEVRLSGASLESCWLIPPPTRPGNRIPQGCPSCS